MFRRIAITALAGLLVLVAFTRTFDDIGRDYTDRAMRNAVVTFAVARVLNGVVSVAQGTNVSVAPAGIGINLTVGEILDPINDLLEQFSWVMVAAITSLGIQKILLVISGSLGFSVLLAVAAGYLVAAVWWPTGRYLRIGWGVKATLAVVALRFALALVLMANHGVYLAFMAEEVSGATQALERATGEIRQLDSGALSAGGSEPSSDRPPDAGEGGWIGGLRGLFAGDAAAVDPGGRIGGLQQRMAATIDQIFSLIAIFALQSIIIPVVFLWVIYRFCRWLITTDPNRWG